MELNRTTSRITFLSTLSLRRATLIQVMPHLTAHLFLSTLSLRRATLNLPSSPIDKNISIHALLAESDEHTDNGTNANLNFYPRSPCGERLVDGSKSSVEEISFLSTLSLRRATVGQKRFRQKLAISIHALLAESDPQTYHQYPKDYRFLSTLSLRRATFIGPLIFSVQPHFYPRSPCGERLHRHQQTA